MPSSWSYLHHGLASAVLAELLFPGGSAVPTLLQDELPLALARFPQAELRDVDCDQVRGALVDWPSLRAQVQRADDEWQAPEKLPKNACLECLETEHEYSDFLIVFSRARDAAAECVLGALAAVLLLLICTTDCPMHAPAAVADVFEELWKATLIGERALPAYMLGTSSWPVASLLAKWQAHCTWANPDPARHDSDDAACGRPEVMEFSRTTQLAAAEELLPLLWRAEPGLAPERALGIFASRIVRAVAVFMNSAAAALVKLAEICPGSVAAQGAILMLFRLLGPPVDHDPLHGPRLSALGTALAQLSLKTLISGTPWPIAAVLAAARHLAWRSHRIFREVPLAEVRGVLELGAGQLKQRRSERPASARWRGKRILESLRGDVVARRRLWEEVTASVELAALWRQVARWLIAGEHASGPEVGTTAPCTAGQTCSRGRASKLRLQITSPQSSPVFLTMGFGNIEGQWLQSFLLRALDVRMQRLIFVTPDKAWLLMCEKIRQTRAAERRLLCIRCFTPHARPYDHNNKAKFYLLPILLSLGVDIAWLDLDIFVFKDPTWRLLEQAYRGPGQSKDVVVTDHFDEHCLNHGVFMVRSSDRSLLWVLRYIEWLHWYPFGHDQNGWDAFLRHSIVEPQLPAALHTDAAINVSYGILSTELEYVTLTGWAGPLYDRSAALLLHFTTTQGISFKEKKRRLMNLFNATGRRVAEEVPDVRRLHMATWKELARLRASRPLMKRPCYEGIHMVVGQLLDTGFYEELLA